jgi:hypothetical protein
MPPLTLLLAVLGLGLLPGLARPADGPDRAGLHPQDGPDAELRVAVREDHVLVRLRLNLVFVDRFVELPREAEDRLDPVELPAYAEALSELLRTQLRVEVDGQALAFESEPASYMPAIDNLVGLFPVHGARALAVIQLPLRFPIEQAPRRVAITWGLFPENSLVPGGPAAPIEVTGQLNDGRYDTPMLFTRAEPQFTWHGEVQDPGAGFLPVPEAIPAPPRPAPWLTLGLLAGCLPLFWRPLRRPLPALLLLALVAGSGLLGRERLRSELGPPRSPEIAPELARQVFEALLKNLYSAFDYERESDIYDALAKSAEGPLLARLYGQIYTALVLEDEGGAMARVEAVTPLETRLLGSGQLPGSSRNSFAVQAKWQLRGKVTHFGHSHERTTAYEARFTLAEAEGRWRIVGDEPLGSQVVSATSNQ